MNLATSFLHSFALFRDGAGVPSGVPAAAPVDECGAGIEVGRCWSGGSSLLSSTHKGDPRRNTCHSCVTGSEAPAFEAPFTEKLARCWSNGRKIGKICQQMRVDVEIWKGADG